MNKLLLFTLLILFNMATQAQSPAEDRTASSFMRYYNITHYDSIWHMFSPGMQGALSLSRANEFFSGVRNRFGALEDASYSHKKAGMTTYKLKFENGIMALNFALDGEQQISSLTITQYVPANLPPLERNITPLQLPFTGTWTIFWGGDTKELNHHVNVPAQKRAFDIAITDDKGSSHRTDGKTNEDYYAFGQQIIAPCDAEVVLAVDGVKDNVPGTENPIYIPGNSVMLKTKNNEYMLFAHFKQHSVQVKEGDKVTQGQLLGYCGNSGNSTEPHLHFHMENVEDMNIAEGAKCYFAHIFVNDTEKKDYSPIKGDKVKNK